MNTYEWYETLVKPTWAPPAEVFGPVWSVLYIIIAISFIYVFYRTYHGTIPRSIAGLFVFNLLVNVLFTPLQFGLQNNFLAAIDISLILVSLLGALYYIYPYARWVALINLPYLFWVLFATILQFTITYLNW